MPLLTSVNQIMPGAGKRFLENCTPVSGLGRCFVVPSMSILSLSDSYLICYGVFVHSIIIQYLCVQLTRVFMGAGAPLLASYQPRPVPHPSFSMLLISAFNIESWEWAWAVMRPSHCLCVPSANLLAAFYCHHCLYSCSPAELC